MSSAKRLGPDAMEKSRRRLTELRREIELQFRGEAERLPETTHPPGEHEVAPSEGFAAAQSLELNHEARLRSIDDALARIESGEYGTCKRCGKTIAAARLEAVPDTRHCIDCERAVEEHPEDSETPGIDAARHGTGP